MWSVLGFGPSGHVERVHGDSIYTAAAVLARDLMPADRLMVKDQSAAPRSAAARNAFELRVKLIGAAVNAG